MTRNRLLTGVLLLLALLLAPLPAPAQPVAGDGAAAVEPALGFVPVAIWELRREGSPTIRHAWVAGSDKVLRISFDEGATWYGFRPVFSDTARGLLALKLQVREELGRGEVGWTEKGGVTLTVGAEAKVTLSAIGNGPALDVTLKLIEIKEVSPSELKAESPQVESESAEPEGLVMPMAGGGGGLGHCCLACGSTIVCDCSVCIVECHVSCCLGGCFCLTC